MPCRPTYGLETLGTPGFATKSIAQGKVDMLVDHNDDACAIWGSASEEEYVEEAPKTWSRTTADQYRRSHSGVQRHREGHKTDGSDPYQMHRGDRLRMPTAMEDPGSSRELSM